MTILLETSALNFIWGPTFIVPLDRSGGSVKSKDEG